MLEPSSAMLLRHRKKSTSQYVLVLICTSSPPVLKPAYTPICKHRPGIVLNSIHNLAPIKTESLTPWAQISTSRIPSCVASCEGPAPCALSSKSPYVCLAQRRSCKWKMHCSYECMYKFGCGARTQRNCGVVKVGFSQYNHTIHVQGTLEISVMSPVPLCNCPFCSYRATLPSLRRKTSRVSHFLHARTRLQTSSPLPSRNAFLSSACEEKWCAAPRATFHSTKSRPVIMHIAYSIFAIPSSLQFISNCSSTVQRNTHRYCYDFAYRYPKRGCLRHGG